MQYKLKEYNKYKYKYTCIHRNSYKLLQRIK